MFILILKILGILLLVFTGILLSTLFIQLKVRLQGAYCDKKGSGEISLYWIKYVFDLRCRIADTDHLHFVLRLFFIPIPFRLSLKKTASAHRVKEPKKAETQKPRFEKEMVPESTPEKEALKDRITHLLDTKDQLFDVWKKYYPFLKKIYVRYITFTPESLTARIGFSEPSQTALAAGMSYSIIPLSPFHMADIQWDFEDQGLAFALRIKITMKLYGIFCTLLHLYWVYNKG
ncbi:MAG: hypothetical protein K0B52_06520, partial [FCB group bacterium]|nr:hypothetical protein [FCB group bacterium]